MQHGHLALYLPEILCHIFSFLVPNNQQEENKSKTFSDILPCLFVSNTWHHYASKTIWRTAHFDDKQYEFEAFLKFAATLKENDIGLPRPTLTPPSGFTDLSIEDSMYSPSRSSSTSTVSSYSVDTPGCQSAEMECKQMDSDYLRNKLEMSANRYNRINNYCYSLRSLSIRKIKLKSLNEPLKKVGEIAKQLSYLDIYICDNIDQQVLMPFLEHQTLTYLSLAGCSLIADDCVIQVARKCPRLEYLDLRACGQVSDSSISIIAKECPRLRHLNVGRVRDREKITIDSIGMIAKHTKASVLGLAGCEVNDKCMELLAKHRGAGLERVSVNSCSKISNRTIHAFVQHCPNLSVFEMKECLLVDDWEAIAKLSQRKVLLTLCDVQTKAFNKWARLNGKILDLKAPQK